MDKLTALVLEDNEGKRITILCRSWYATKDGITIRSLDNSYIGIDFKEHQCSLWDFQDVSVSSL